MIRDPNDDRTRPLPLPAAPWFPPRDDATRALLEERARQADARRFTGAPLTGFGE